MQNDHNPSRYSEMSKPKTVQETNDSVRNFLDDVKAARERHKIADVHVILRVNIERDGDEVSALSGAHFGAVQESEGMCAWAFARAGEARRSFVDHCKSIGAAAIRGA